MDVDLTVIGSDMSVLFAQKAIAHVWCESVYVSLSMCGVSLSISQSSINNKLIQIPCRMVRGTTPEDFSWQDL
jgi:hypothetical protein